MKKTIDFLKRHPKIYTMIRYIYTPIRDLKTKKFVKKYGESALLKIKKLNNQSKNLFYFGIPIHTNLGDLAQYYCIKKWLQDNYFDYNLVCIETYGSYNKKFLKELNKKLNSDSIIVFQSGYCTKENHLDHKMHRKLIKLFPNNKFIFFPQTVKFFDFNELKKTAKIYNRASDITFLARDQISFETAKKYFISAKVLLYPDIVTELIGNIPITTPRKKGLLLCLRNDGEKLFSDSAFKDEELVNKFDFIDKCDTTSPYNYSFTIENLETVLLEFLKKLSNYKVIITDRYHGTIFSLIANTKVIVVPTNDHKVTTGAKWFDGVYDSVTLVDSPRESIKLALSIQSYETKNLSCFKEKYYDVLINEIGE